MSLFLGIDQSANHTGVCILSDGAELHYLGLIEPKALREGARLAFIRDTLTELLAGRRFAVGVMEGYAYNAFNTGFMLSEVAAVVKLAFYDHCDVAYIAAPKQLKKFVTSKGTSSKEDVMFAIEKQWGVVIEDDNKADAYGLARIGYEITRPESLKRHQLEVVKELTKPVVKKPKTRGSKKAPFKDAV